MDLLREKFQWILPCYMMKRISFQSKASVVCSVTAAIFIDFCLKKLSVFSQHISKNKWISEFRRTNPQELKCWSTFCVNYFLRYYLMMQHQPLVKRVNGRHEWAHGPYPASISSLSLLLVQTHAARWKTADTKQQTGANLYLDRS